MQLELALLVLWSVCWLLTVVSGVAGSPFAGALPLTLYHLYGFASAGGWLSGNLFVQRSRRLPRRLGRRLLSLYLLGPPGALYLLFGLSPGSQQTVAPLAPLYAFGVFAIFFLVPVSLKHSLRR